MSKNVKKTLRTLISNYDNMERSIVKQLMINVPAHHPTTGSYREEIWKNLFEMIIPKKYYIEQSVFIMDSKGHISKEVDLAIFDETYTPYIFRYGKIIFIPIEAVAMVIQCKSKIENKKTYNNIKAWVDSVDGLETSLNSIARIYFGVVNNANKEDKKDTKTQLKTQTATRPIKILCATEISEQQRKQLEESFDILIHIDDDCKGLIKTMKYEKEDFSSWYYSLNHSLSIEEEQDSGELEQKGIQSVVRLKKNFVDLAIKNKESKENVIMSLTFQLNQMLMLINNPMLFPHIDYAECFKEIMKENDSET